MASTWQAEGLDRCREVRRRVNELGAEKAHCSASELRMQSEELRRRRSEGVVNDNEVAEALAIFYEATERALGLRISDAQVTAAAAMCVGMIAELPYIEPTSWAAMLASYWHSLSGNSVHVVFSSDYLAERDAFSMSAIGMLLGMRVGLVTCGSTAQEKRAAYASDVTFGRYLDLMWDYLRDDLQDSSVEVVQRGLHTAIVSDIDSILVDYANVPATITVPSEGVNRDKVPLVSSMMHIGEHFRIDGGKLRFTRAGLDLLAAGSGAGSLESLNVSFARQVESAIRLREGLRGDDRLIYSAVSVRGFFRCYDTVVGLTAMAGAISEEIERIYGLRCLPRSFQETSPQIAHPDALYPSDASRLRDLARRVAAEHAKGRPVLIGAISAELAERICTVLESRRIQCRPLVPGQEAKVVARAGQRGAVTVINLVTERPDRIELGGDVGLLALEELRNQGLDTAGSDLAQWSDPYQAARAAVLPAVIVERADLVGAGGLAVFGVGRGFSRRANDWLRNCAGAPGEKWFLLSRGDPPLVGLDRAFRWPRVHRVALVDDSAFGVTLKHKIVDREVVGYQAAISGRLDSWRYELIVEGQRLEIRSLRHAIRGSTDLGSVVAQMIDQVVDETFTPDNINTEMVQQKIEDITGPVHDSGSFARQPTEQLSAGPLAPVKVQLHSAYKERARDIGSTGMRRLEQKVMLTCLDLNWCAHLNWLHFALLHAHEIYAPSRDALAEYRRDASDRFGSMLRSFRLQSLKYLFGVRMAQSNGE